MIRNKKAVAGTLLATLLLAGVGRAQSGQEVTGERLPSPARSVLQEVMQASEVGSVRITSTERTPREQVQAMYGFIRRHGPEAAYRLYGPEGDAVVASYEKHVSKGQRRCRAAMLTELRRQLPKAHENNRLMHTKSTHYVFDVAIRSVPSQHRTQFVTAARQHPRISRFLGPADGEKDAYHVEIPKRTQANEP